MKNEIKTERELKFRAWNGSVFVYFALSGLNGFKATQYTGLKDSKGTEVYEGDILELDIDDKEKAVKNRMYVVWQEDTAGFMFRNVENNLMIIYHTEIVDNWKVIGNIYENPEILEKSKN